MSTLVDSLPVQSGYPSRRALYAWLGLGLLAAAAFVLLGEVPLTGGGFVVCAFKRTTGISCPGCGMTRAMAALARGDLWAALQLHPFAPLLLVESVWLWLAGARSLLRRGVLDLPSKLIERLIVWQGAALLVLWIARLATGTLPP
jgi:uncharacterized protein DUF2752